jgi:AraC-like DNA-binding protein
MRLDQSALMETAALQLSDDFLGKFRLTRFRDVAELESGGYWPQLQPYFIKPYFRRLTYRLTARTSERPSAGSIQSIRGASGFGELDIAYVADRPAMAMSITDTGLPDYCLTLVLRGALEYRDGPHREPVDLNPSTGLIYRGLPGTRLSATDNHERLAIWIPAETLTQRLAALLDEPVGHAPNFFAAIDWESGAGRTLRRVLRLLVEEVASTGSSLLNGVARQSLIDLVLYTLLQSVPHSYTERLARDTASPAPRSVRRAEAFIRAHTDQPIALHEVADAAGCSVRALQLAFRQFRETTPAEAIRQARLEAARQALARGDAEGTVADVAVRFGFTNPSRFARLFRASYGVSPADALRGGRPRLAGPR